MPKVVRIGDTLSTGHGCTGTTTIASSNQTTTNVYADNILVDVVGAPTVSHPFPPDPPCAPHTAQLNAGSPNVYINSIKVGRIGDSADAGAMTTGSPTVYANS
jgi:uncharacterized Zn-binding protein involved in type VI secretion|tara:strand:- start:928 stop:1236 length:309 start_codon:yes stop_codon:yes gene_type:complete